MVQLSDVAESSVHLDLATALPVVGESTTSRVLLYNELLRVVQFTFDSGQLLTEHTSPRAVVVELVSGRITFTVRSTDHAMGPGDVIYLAPGDPHALVAHEPSRLTLVMVDAEAARLSS